MNFSSSGAAVAEMGERLGHIDALVNNAGINDAIGLEHGTPERCITSLEFRVVYDDLRVGFDHLDGYLK
jgi:NAD(P)-dependent dehydrogenase (short-subunit alcohol dehydrogenase family)